MDPGIGLSTCYFGRETAPFCLTLSGRWVGNSFSPFLLFLVLPFCSAGPWRPQVSKFEPLWQPRGALSQTELLTTVLEQSEIARLHPWGKKAGFDPGRPSGTGFGKS